MCGRRLSGVLEAVGLHRRLLQRPLSGVIHALIFCSFFVLFTAIPRCVRLRVLPGLLVTQLRGRHLDRSVAGRLRGSHVGWRGHGGRSSVLLRPQRFEGSNQVDAVVIYVLIEAIVLSMLMQAAFAILGGAPSGWRPVSGLLAHALAVSGIPVGVL